MSLREIELTLPPGFRFYPSDEELVCHYLHKKVANERVSQGTMVEVDLHTREPWELPDVAKLSANEWYFFSFRDRKYATGSRTNRATRSGYWKATGKDRTVYDPVTGCDVVGMRKTLVFYGGRAPNGVKTDWVMHEFRLESPHSAQKEADWVLCRVFSKKKGDPTNRTSFENNRDDSISSGSRNKTNDEDVKFGGSGSSSNSLLNLAVLHCNLVGFPIPQEVEDGARMVDVGSCELGTGDDCEVMLDMSTEDMQELFGLGVANLAAGGISFHATNDNVFF